MDHSILMKQWLQSWFKEKEEDEGNFEEEERSDRERESKRKRQEEEDELVEGGKRSAFNFFQVIMEAPLSLIICLPPSSLPFFFSHVRIASSCYMS